MATILVANTLVILLSTCPPALRPNRDWFVVFKVFAAGTLLATSSTVQPVQLPESHSSGSSWSRFTSPEFAATLAVVAAMIVNSIVGPYLVNRRDAELWRFRFISLVFEVGVVLNSVPIGLIIGGLRNECLIKKLLLTVGLSNVIQGMCLGAIISEARFGIRMSRVMSIIYIASLPSSVLVAMKISDMSFHDQLFRALTTVRGISTGVFSYSSLVDLLASELNGPRLRRDRRLQFLSYGALFVGAVVGFAVVVYL